MKLKKKDLLEIINTNGELIGKEDIPNNGSDLESVANNTTDYNAKISTQPYRYDMLGRFGFTLMPFMEGKENKTISNDKIIKLLHDMFRKTLEYYYRNPNKLKSDFRVLSQDNASDEEREKIEDYWANVVQKMLEPHFDDESENIDETKVSEDKMVDKKSEDEISPNVS